MQKGKIGGLISYLFRLGKQEENEGELGVEGAGNGDEDAGCRLMVQWRDGAYGVASLEKMGGRACGWLARKVLRRSWG